MPSISLITFHGNRLYISLFEDENLRKARGKLVNAFEWYDMSSGKRKHTNQRHFIPSLFISMKATLANAASFQTNDYNGKEIHFNSVL